MSKSVKKSSKSVKSANQELIDTLAAMTAEAAGSEAPKQSASPKVRFYELRSADHGYDRAKGQKKLVLDAIKSLAADDQLAEFEPIRADVLVPAIAKLVKDAYKVKAGNGDLNGSIGFWLHQLSREGNLRQFDARQDAEGAWVEVVPSKMAA